MQKQLPFSLETEKQILLGFIESPRLLLDFVDDLQPEHFYDERSVQLYKLLQKMHKDNRVINMDMVTEEILKKDAHFSFSYLIDFYAASEYQLPLLVARLKELAFRRAAIQKTQKMLIELYEDKPFDEVVEHISKSVSELSGTATRRKSQHISAIIPAMFEEFKQQAEGNRHVATGFKDLDAAFYGGLLPGQLIVVGARQGMGKTSFAVSLTNNVLRAGKTIAFYTLEMSNEALVAKLICVNTQTSYDSLQRYGAIQPHRYQHFIESIRALDDATFFCEDSCYALSQIKQDARATKKDEGKLDLIIIDYLGLIKPDGSKENRVAEVSAITRDLKIFAKEIDAPIILLAQINREAEKNSLSSAPKAYQLKESGSIEQDADAVILLHRPGAGDNANPDYSQSHAELILAKNRLGACGKFEIHFETSTMHFRDTP